MVRVYDLNPVSYIAIGTLGEPGQRVFYLQAGRGRQLVTLIIEKQHALALASSLDDLLAELAARFPRPPAATPTAPAMGLREPIEPLFRVGQMGMGYDQGSDRIVLIAYELAPEEGPAGSVVRFWATREQMKALRNQAIAALEGGRPECPLCGELIDPGGHLCPRRNGHGNHPRFVEWAD